MKNNFRAATWFVYRNCEGKIVKVRPAHDVTPATEAAVLKYLLGGSSEN